MPLHDVRDTGAGILACPDEHRVQHRAFPAAIWSDEDRQRRKVFELAFTDAAKIGDFN